ncbi:hypothetical protein EVAR_54238_1 [Eumeta japonica]|uniref:Uncharacterized protein n=1 Tax=Eumeta variegata TaxID=151549 RepID=A0A4C1YFJ1_EUMVA|nr:hypothetical protein EVAR_54238_1 [Eumeta japonica]
MEVRVFNMAESVRARAEGRGRNGASRKRLVTSETNGRRAKALITAAACLSAAACGYSPGYPENAGSVVGTSDVLIVECCGFDDKISSNRNATFTVIAPSASTECETTARAHPTRPRAADDEPYCHVNSSLNGRIRIVIRKIIDGGQELQRRRSTEYRIPKDHHPRKLIERYHRIDGSDSQQQLLPCQRDKFEIQTPRSELGSTWQGVGLLWEADRNLTPQEVYLARRLLMSTQYRNYASILCSMIYTLRNLQFYTSYFNRVVCTSSFSCLSA